MKKKIIPLATLALVSAATAHAGVIATNSFSTPTVTAGENTLTSAWTPGTDSGFLTLGTIFTTSASSGYRTTGSGGGALGGDGTNMLNPNVNANGITQTITFSFTVGAAPVQLTSFDFSIYALAGTGLNQTQSRSYTFTLDVKNEEGTSVFTTTLPTTSATENPGATGNPGGQYASVSFASALSSTAQNTLIAGGNYTLILSTSSTSGGSFVAFDDFAISASATAVPEPSTYGLIGAGALAGVALVRRRRKVA